MAVIGVAHRGKPHCSIDLKNPKTQNWHLSSVISIHSFAYLSFSEKLFSHPSVPAGIKIKKGDACAKAMDVHLIDANPLDAVVRLVRLTDEPESSNVLAPLIVKEIIYRLLPEARRAARSSLTVQRHPTHLAGDWAPPRAEPLKIDDIARELGMSISGFHHHGVSGWKSKIVDVAC